MNLSNDGSLFACGSNDKGQLGLGDNKDRNIPTRIPGIYAKAIACGIAHTIIIDLNDNVWAFGLNDLGQLGVGDNDRRYVPTPILFQGNRFKAKAVACGEMHTVIIDLENNVWVCGSNSSGQLGLGENVRLNVPSLLPRIQAKHVACGQYYTILIDMDNEVWAFGNNHYGQLGLNTNYGQVESGNSQDVNVPTQILLQGGNKLKAQDVDCGQGHTMVIDLDGNVWAFGLNYNGQLGLSHMKNRNVPMWIQWNYENKAKSVSCGNYHTMITDLDNNIWAIGTNKFGQLGLGDNQDRNKPTSLAIQGKFVSCGGYHTMITDLNSEAWAFGNNDKGQLGLGNNQSINVPTPILSQGNKVKAEKIDCGQKYTVLILSPSQFGNNIHLISFDEAARKLNVGDFINFNFLPEYQVIPHNLRNYIASFYDTNGNIYLAELQYDQNTNQILPPL